MENTRYINTVAASHSYTPHHVSSDNPEFALGCNGELVRLRAPTQAELRNRAIPQ